MEPTSPSTLSSNQVPLPQALVINLANSPERWMAVKAECEKHGITPIRMEAVYGKDIDPETLKTITSRECFKYCTKGAIGCWRSHLACWRYILTHRLDRMLILEDDAQLIDGFQEKFREYGLDSLNYDFVMLGHTFTDTPSSPFRLLLNVALQLDSSKDRPISENVFRPAAFFGTPGYVMTLAGAQRLIDQFQITTEHIDMALAKVINSDETIRVLAATPPLVYQVSQTSTSTISSTFPTTLNSLADRVLISSDSGGHGKASLGFLLSEPVRTITPDMPINGWLAIFIILGMILALINSPDIQFYGFLGILGLAAAESAINSSNVYKSAVMLAVFSFGFSATWVVKGAVMS